MPAILLLAAACASAYAAAGATLDQVKARGTLRCGVSEGVPGFSSQDAKGRWTGIDVDFCRAIAIAVIGDENKVTFVPLRASARFPALRARQIDVLARNTTWTLAREAGLKVRFTGVLYYDGQGFMVPAKSGIKSLTALKGATVCVEKGTTSSSNLAAYSAERGLNIKPLVIDSALEVADQFFAGKCRAYTADVSQLAGARVRAPGGPQAMVILPDRISKEPLGPAVRDGDEDWFTLVRWVLFMLIGMEEAGLTAENMAKRVNDPHLKHAIGDTNELSRMLGVKPGWALRTLQTVGNYGQMYERNLGPGTPLKLERGLNKLWTDGGLMYAPPLQ